MEAINRVPEWLRAIILLVVGGVIGWGGNYYIDYRSDFREQLSANYSKFDEASTQINESLRTFAEVAQGLREKSDEDVAALQLKLLAAVAAAEDMDRRLGPKESSAVEAFKRAAVDLKLASELVEGPLDAKTLVSAVNDYLAAERELRDMVVIEGTRFLF